MSRLESLATEGAKRRVRQDLAAAGGEPSKVPAWAIVGVSLALFIGAFVFRLVVDDPGTLIANIYTLPIAILAIAFGLRAGLAAAAFAFFLVWLWGQLNDQHLGVLAYSTRATVFVLVGALVGHYSERLRRDIGERRRAEAELAIRARDLEVSNAELSRAVTQLEAFAEIARAVGGETELRTVLDRILAHGRAILPARTLVAYLEKDGELAAAASTDDSLAGLPPRAESVEQVMDPGRLVVRLRWQGETLGALVALGGEFDDEAHELMGSIAASAATAVATAQSAAADRLRHTIQASEEARARWARELHDETLQGLVGLRMLLASARRSGTGVDEALEQTRREIVSLRSLIAELRPAALDELGLGPAIETLSERSALSVRTSVSLRNGDLPRLASETETTVYRVVQEALMNAARHSGGSLARVDVAEHHDLIDVTVADDGSGFDPVTTDGGFGLRGMRERVQLAGGSMTIDSSGDGSVVRARLPARRPEWQNGASHTGN